MRPANPARSSRLQFVRLVELWFARPIPHQDMTRRTSMLSLLSFLILGCMALAQESTLPEDRAKAFEIRSLGFTGATAEEALNFFVTRTAEVGQPRIKIVYLGSSTDRFDFALVSTPLLDVLQLMALDAGLRVGATDEALYLYHDDDPQAQALNIRKLRWSTSALTIAAERAAAQRAAYVKARLQLLIAYGAKDVNDQSTTIPMPEEVFKTIQSLEESERRCTARVEEAHRLLRRRLPSGSAFGELSRSDLDE
jgi:hypothetical protein